MEPSQVGALDFMGSPLSYKIFIGYIGEWDLSNGDLVDHSFHDGEVFRIALSGDKIVTCDFYAIRVFDISLCLLVLFQCCSCLYGKL